MGANQYQETDDEHDEEFKELGWDTPDMDDPELEVDHDETIDEQEDSNGH